MQPHDKPKARRLLNVHAEQPPAPTPAEGPQLGFVDPVCGMEVVRASATVTHAGQKYYFCTAACRDKFLKNPEQYVGSKKTS